ncbi:MAG: L-seryl-tRNA(Sec) selenium transferase [Deltaproteobacteria bacterium]|nr:L-seryl-tRNA(Sec) selenium transferase [Deltaproteobacteria bacterium]
MGAVSQARDPRTERLRALPSVRVLVEAVGDRAPRWAAVEAARRLIAARRQAIVGGADEVGGDAIEGSTVIAAAQALAQVSLRPVINATGVVLHTNLGRAPLAPAAIDAVVEVARGYANLEYDVDRGARGSRHAHLAGLLRAITGAEDAVVVNNNAAATMLGLAALAAGREVIVSRGELVEIGGSFRLPDVLRMSGCRLVEVGTTNKTRLADYEAAIGPDTALLLKVHRSNFAIVGFTAEVSASELATLGRARGVASMIDLGSGALVDRAAQRALGLPEEPPVAEAVASGVDLVCFSGDKLLGGPQAGILAGDAAAIARARSHPLMRALRPDKLTIAALAATLALYRADRAGEIPVLAMLALGDGALADRAGRLKVAIGEVAGIAVEVVACTGMVGGGTLPLAELPSWAVALRRADEAGPGADAIDAALRSGAVPVIARIDDARVLLDVRTIADSDLGTVAAAVRALASG